ncbi:hypothetical protein, partial [Streptomyces parvulus]|uniref:hypothetical protein n=1 Tax=Streptomyces parvulus TaxID=146923 RepID=UPI0037F86D90
MFFDPAARRAPMVRLRQVAILRCVLPVRSCEASSAKMVSRMWRRASIVQWSRPESGELGRGGLLGGEAGDGLDGGLSGFAVGAAALDLDGPVGSGEEEVVHGGDLDAVDRRASSTGVPGAS